MVKMRYYVARRLLLSLIVLFGVSVITFTIARVIPSEPAAMWIGFRATKEQIEKTRIQLGLDKPLYVQYYRYMLSLLQGDWGVSIRTHAPVLQDIATFLPASLELILTGLVIALVVGIPLGVISAARKNTPADHGARLLAIAGVSIPTFWLGMMFQLVFFRIFAVLPVAERLDPSIELTFTRVTGFYLLDAVITGNLPAFQSAATHIILPALTLAAYPLGLATRMIRATMMEVMSEDYIRTSRAYGIPERVVRYSYALKNAVGPTITVLPLTFAYALVETFLIESVFRWPGLGRYASIAIISADYPAIIGVTILIAIIYIVLNLAADLIHAYLDPRIQLR